MKQLITFLLLFTAGITFAQQVRVIGKADQQPISQCYIYNADKSVTAVTNLEGIADLSGFGPKDMLTFSHISYVPLVIERPAIVPGITKIELTIATINLQEVVLSANKVEEP